MVILSAKSDAETEISFFFWAGSCSSNYVQTWFYERARALLTMCIDIYIYLYWAPSSTAKNFMNGINRWSHPNRDRWRWTWSAAVDSKAWSTNCLATSLFCSRALLNSWNYTQIVSIKYSVIIIIITIIIIFVSIRSFWFMWFQKIDQQQQYKQLQPGKNAKAKALYKTEKCDNSSSNNNQFCSLINIFNHKRRM